MKTFDDSRPSGFNQPNEQDQLANDAVKGAAWLLGIVGVFALAILITWIANINHSPFTSLAERSAPRPAATMPLKAPAPQHQYIAIVTPAPAAAPAIVAPAPKITSASLTSPKVTTESAASTTLSKADQDRIEREAIAVIHGDFGNNPGRKAQLGADYAAVQARVNQLLHI